MYYSKYLCNQSGFSKGALLIPHSEMKQGLNGSQRKLPSNQPSKLQATKIYFFSWKQKKSCQGPTSGLWKELMTISYLECVKQQRIWTPRDLEPDDQKHVDESP